MEVTDSKGQTDFEEEVTAGDGEAKHNCMRTEMTLFEQEMGLLRGKRPLKVHNHITCGGKQPRASGNSRS